MKIVIGADPYGFELKKAVKKHLEEQGHELIDLGMTDAAEEKIYYNIAAEAARAIQNGEAERGILFCGTGMGLAIAANKFKGVIASVVESEYAAKMCRVVNNANVLTLGGMFVAPFKALMAVDAFLTTGHTEGHEDIAGLLKDGIAKVAEYEETNMK